jgi:hypothetical protein
MCSTMNIKSQEYVPVTYTTCGGNGGIPIAWRIKKHSGGWAMGNCPGPYGQIFLDEIWEIVWNEQWQGKPVSDERKVLNATQLILEVYFHEFLHAYFFRRMDWEDMEKEIYITPKKTIKQVKGRLRSERWGWSEKMVGTLALNLMYRTLLYDDFTIFLMNTFRDEIENIRANQNT